jgi:hypothetical protein
LAFVGEQWSLALVGEASSLDHRGRMPQPQKTEPRCGATSLEVFGKKQMDKRRTAQELGVASETAATWVDPQTGLEWQCGSPGLMTWHEALHYARSLVLTGYTDWRLPTVRELESLLDRSRYRPEMRTDIPFRDELSYWSATTFGPHRHSAWIVMFDGAYVLSYYKTNLHHVRCLRGQWKPGYEGIQRERNLWQSTA